MAISQQDVARARTRSREELKTIADTVGVARCKYCLGPVGESWDTCIGCSYLFSNDTAKRAADAIVPILVATKGTPQYALLSRYKVVGSGEDLAILAWAVHRMFGLHRERIEATLGGSIDQIFIVPSTRSQRQGQHPLYSILSAPSSTRRLVVDGVRPTGDTVARCACSPGAFEITTAVAERVVVIDDAWVSGASLISVAAAIRSSGAQAVLAMPIARVIDASWWGADHPYVKAVESASYHPSRWPIA